MFIWVCLWGIEKKINKNIWSSFKFQRNMFITAPALDCGRMLWDMGSRNKVKILKGMKILNFIHHLFLHRAGTHFQSADKLHVKKKYMYTIFCKLWSHLCSPRIFISLRDSAPHNPHVHTFSICTHIQM